jgi:hypothetical protein
VVRNLDGVGAEQRRPAAGQLGALLVVGGHAVAQRQERHLRVARRRLGGEHGAAQADGGEARVARARLRALARRRRAAHRRTHSLIFAMPDGPSRCSASRSNGTWFFAAILRFHSNVSSCHSSSS